MCGICVCVKNWSHILFYFNVPLSPSALNDSQKIGETLQGVLQGAGEGKPIPGLWDPHPHLPTGAVWPSCSIQEAQQHCTELLLVTGESDKDAKAGILGDRIQSGGLGPVVFCGFEDLECFSQSLETPLVSHWALIVPVWRPIRHWVLRWEEDAHVRPVARQIHQNPKWATHGRNTRGLSKKTWPGIDFLPETPRIVVF